MILDITEWATIQRGLVSSYKNNAEFVEKMKHAEFVSDYNCASDKFIKREMKQIKIVLDKVNQHLKDILKSHVDKTPAYHRHNLRY